MIPSAVLKRTLNQAEISRLLVYTCSLLLLFIPIPLEATIEDLLQKGNHLLAAGQFNDALSLYVKAVDEDPNNHVALFGRGSAYLALGKFRLALLDFDQAVKLNEGYRPAVTQRATLNLKMGNLVDAKTDFERLWFVFKYLEATDKLSLIEKLEVDHSDAVRLLKSGMCRDALELLDRLVSVMQYDHKLREMRADCYLKLGDLQRGIHEMRYGVHLVNDNREGLLHVSKLMYSSGMAVQSLEEIRECLRLDQEDKDCLKLYRVVKKLAASITNAQSALDNSQYAQCIGNATQMMNLERSNPEYGNQAKILLCQCHARSQSEDGLKYCEEVAKLFAENVDLQCDLAESHINSKNFETAIEICQRILDMDRGNQRAKRLHGKAQKLLRNSQRPDYYGILGVSSSATKKEISRAYRKLAKEWHPDKFSGQKKKTAEKMFLDISAAKEVLTDDDLRAKYDNGEDPLNPKQQQQHYQSPFGQFGGFSFTNMPFGDGHFEFHFG